MQLSKIQGKKKCDVAGCGNVAEYDFEVKNIFKKQICLCEECLKKMFKLYVGTAVPKPICSPFKPNSRIKKEKR